MTALSEAILHSSVRLAQENGLEGWSIERVAQGAKCAKGLVIHHYQTRANLLQATGIQIAKIRLERRLASLQPGGMEALDALWATLVDDLRSGLTRATFSLAAHRSPTRHPDDAAKLHRAIARALAVPGEVLADPIAVLAMLEGIEFQLLREVAAETVKIAFDRLWVSLITE